MKKMEDVIQRLSGRSSHLIAALGFTIWGLYLRYDRLAHRELWIDETNQIKGTIGPLKEFWGRPDYGELTVFPGDYLLTWLFVNWAPDNKWIIMIPHIIATVVSFWLLYLICRRYMSTIFGTLVAFAVFTFNTSLIFHAFELRPYAALIPLSLAVFYCTEMIVSSAHRLSGLQKFWIGALFFLTIQFHAYGILIVFFCAVFFLLKELFVRPLQDVFRHIFKFYTLVCLFSLPVWFWYATGVPSFTREQSLSRGINVFEYIPNPLVNPVGSFKSVFGNMIGYKLFYPLLAGIAAALVIPHRQRFAQIIFFIVLVMIPVTVICLADISKGYWFLQRQFVWVMPLFAFFLGWCLDSIIVFVMKKMKGGADA